LAAIRHFAARLQPHFRKIGDNALLLTGLVNVFAVRRYKNEWLAGHTLRQVMCGIEETAGCEVQDPPEREIPSQEGNGSWRKTRWNAEARTDVRGTLSTDVFVAHGFAKQLLSNMPRWSGLESQRRKRGCVNICGVDEASRAPLAGPGFGRESVLEV